jgi:hypothetical protein
MAIQSAEKTLILIKNNHPELVTIISRDLNKNLSNCKMLPFHINLYYPTDTVDYHCLDYVRLLSILLDESGYEHEIRTPDGMGFISEIQKENSENLICVNILKLKLNRS